MIVPTATVIPQSASGDFNLTAAKIRRHYHRRVHSGARKALEVVLTHRLHLGWGRSDAANLRAVMPGPGSCRVDPFPNRLVPATAASSKLLRLDQLGIIPFSSPQESSVLRS